jgi:hypothetical protein
MAIAPVLKTGVRKDLGVRIPRPPWLLIVIDCDRFIRAAQSQARSVSP